MPDGLTIGERLAARLSDDLQILDMSSVADVSIHTHFVAAKELQNVRRDDPLGRHNGSATSRRFTAASRLAYADKIEPVLLNWLREDSDRPAAFADDPAAVIRDLPGLSPDLKMGALQHFSRRKTRATPQLAGLSIKEMTFDAAKWLPAPPPVDPIKGGEDVGADAVFAVGVSHLTRVFAEKLLPGIRQSALQVLFSQPTGFGTLRLVDDGIGDPVLVLRPDNTLSVTIEFQSGFIDTPVLNLTEFGPVTISASLQLTSVTRADGADVDLNVVPGSFSVSAPPTNIVATAVWNAASASLVQQLTPLFSFSMPLTFPAPTDLCEVAPRGIAAQFLQPDLMAGTQGSLALALALLAETDPNGLSAGTASRVKDTEDGSVFLSNLLMVEVACCLLRKSAEFSGLPVDPDHHHPATKDEPWCRWTDLNNFRVGTEVYDSLNYLDIRAENGGIKVTLELAKSGTGWDVTVNITSRLRLNIVDGILSGSAIPDVEIHENIAWWVEWTAILLILGGAALLIIGAIKGNPTAISLGWKVLTLGVVLGGVVLVLGAVLGALTPENLTDTDDVLGLLPNGVADKLGTLSFLNELDWDDLEFGGFLTLPGEPRIVAGRVVELHNMMAIDLDTDDVETGETVGARMDADLRFRDLTPVFESGRFSARMLPQSGPSSRLGALGDVMPFRGKLLEVMGASRLVPFGARPYPTVGYSDLAQLGFPTSPTSIGVPTRRTDGARSAVRTFAVRTTAGRLASCATWTEPSGQSKLQYRTFDTPVCVTIAPEIYIQSFGRTDGYSDQTFIMNATFTAVPGDAWPPSLPTSYRWFWMGKELIGAGVLDQVGNDYTIIGNRCLINTVQGADLKGWLVVVASKPSGLETAASRNVFHIGKIEGSYGGPGSPGGNGPGDDLPGGPPHL